ncbi:TonB-linked outer membrane protein, SusC/RagA family [Dyadobacter soli]|uniref:TonB-linked outer membrane protein, SusC/RagA family n=1 Tax=Dyadobacter soli TaxID=659014 RepID=A0A1G7MI26_9BACT|nr:SusC/RagA family TonB-linked outer membrane protein [Dyadobacter soli]SDF61361.1 TonB-linked outer membrane protein, SusC/RagA family [Dyadobacter soli]
MKTYLYMLLLSCLPLSAIAQGFSVTGRVSDQTGLALPGASVVLKGENVGVTADSSGSFRLRAPGPGTVLVVSFIGYQKKEITLDGRLQGTLQIVLAADLGQLAEVVVSSGYQSIAAERATGSFSRVDQQLLNRRVGADILSRLEDVVPGLVVNRSGVVRPGAQSAISIRGQSTIFARQDPLIVLDNFPYTGDVSQINPNDIESVTILKDAAAASIWGAQSGNGVIVITTKKGKFGSPMQVSFNSNVTLSERPDVFYQPQISTGEYIDIEKMLFERGYYKSAENSDAKIALTPVVKLLIAGRDGKLTSEQVNSAIESLRANDVRNDYRKHLSRTGINQQYSVGLSGGTAFQRYAVSGGYDKSISSLVGDKSSRFTVNATNTYLLFARKIELTTGLYYSNSTAFQNALDGSDLNISAGKPLYPYASLVGPNGEPLKVTHLYRERFLQQASQKGLLDWGFNPLSEIERADNRIRATDYRMNTQLTYRVTPWLSADVLYQYLNTVNQRRNRQDQRSWSVRDLVNRFTSIAEDGSLIRPVPVGDILDISSASAAGHNLRGQLNLNKQLAGGGSIDALVGAEFRKLDTDGYSSRYYGYNDQLASSVQIDYLTNFTSFVNPSSKNNRIPDPASLSGLADRYISWYGNATYMLAGRYGISASARLDQSNLFGVRANQKGVPLYSAGLSWKLSQEKFYKLAWLPQMGLRATYGYNGNVDKTVSAYTTATYLGANLSGTGLPYASITNPPNPELRWERVRMINFALDFKTKGGRISGTFEYYLKKGVDLIGAVPLAAQTGVSVLRGNTANTKGRGAELSVSTHNLQGGLRWDTDLLLSYAADRVSRYLIKPTSVASAYLAGGTLVPAEGKPLYAVYSYKWAGLDPASGDPQGYLDGEVSKDYTAIKSSATLDGLIYNGAARPRVFGALRNTFEYKGFSLSANISFRLGYAVRYASVDYGSILSGAGGHADYSFRWQKPGDENVTHVPSMPLTENVARTEFYTYSDVLVQKGDHIRFQDVNLTYSFSREQNKKLPFGSMQLYLYANNLGLIWKKAEGPLDPDYMLGPAPPKSLALGLRANI